MEIAVARDEELCALQVILGGDNRAISYEETVAIGSELIDFFEALGESNEDDKADGHA